MLSRAGVLSGRQCKNMLAITTRCAATTPMTSISSEKSPEFRRPVRQEPGKVRMGFLPEEWFQFFYKKTGVTGPYAFGLGLSTYLISKEWYVMEHEYYNGLSLALLCIICVKKLGPAVAKWLDKEIDDYEAEWNHDRNEETRVLTEQIKDEEINQWRTDGQMLLVAAKRENVALQIEAAYRQRLVSVYDEVMKRLNYQVELQNVERRIAQKHLVSWVVKHVVGSLTPEQEKQNIDKCISDLAGLAKA